MFWLFSDNHLPPTDAARLRRIEAKLDLIIGHLGIVVPDAMADGLSTEVRALADRGEKIPAIAAYRKQTGVSLKEAKDVVEAYIGR